MELKMNTKRNFNDKGYIKGVATIGGMQMLCCLLKNRKKSH
jgi:hypothetical protein